MILLGAAACAWRPTATVPEPDVPPAFDGRFAFDGAETAYYAVSGRDRGELMVSLSLKAPADGNVRQRGSTRWDIHWTVDRRSDDVCDLATASVTRRLTVVLPHWDPDRNTDPGLVADWERYVRALADHERGHVALLIAGADRIPPAIRAATCSTADAVGQATLDEVRAANAAYDRDTNHGRNQGAWFGPGPVERSALSLPSRR